MESARARALSLLEQLATLGDPRNQRDLNAVSGLTLFLTKYNATCDRLLTLTPSTQEEHRVCFLAALDIVGAILGINLSGILHNYVPNAQVIAHLAREDLPYSTQAYRNVLRILNETSGHSNSSRLYDPYDDRAQLVPPGMFFRQNAQAQHFAYTSSREMSVAVMAGETIDISQTIRPSMIGATQYCFSWAPYHLFYSYAGQVTRQQPRLNVEINRRDAAVGIQHMAAPNSVVTITNTGNAASLVQFTVHWYTKIQAGWDVYPGYKSDCAAVYTYQDAIWSHIRSNICGMKGLPGNRLPINPPGNEDHVFTMAVLARLFEVYTCHRPVVAQAVNRVGGPGLYNQAVQNMGAI
ncbi:VP7 [Umatilla virus]|uniref:Core protein VP7 n=1 Tax=Umatilla virus TaxID=40060 RepID=G8DP09_9REOV|nr:VP7 [Umatilla virus]AEE98375.1 VP7 [Umatilla virus]